MNETFHCKNCGAEVKTELCPYCNSLTGIDISKVKEEYPIEDIKEATINKMLIIPLFIMFIVLLYAGLNVAFDNTPKEVLEDIPIIKTETTILSTILLSLSLLPLFSLIIPIIKNIIVRIKGKEIEGIIYGYTDDTSTIINGNYTKAIKILIDKPEGKRFILYKTDDTKKKYKLNGKIKLLVYKKYYLIKTKKEYLFE